MLKTITKAAVLAAVAGSLNLAVATPADAQVPPSPVANGRRCGFASVTDPQVEGEVQTGQMNGGPIVAASAGADISIGCTIQVGAGNATHAGFDHATATSATTTQVAALAPTAISYPSPAGQPVYQCTEVTINGTTHYWDATITNPGGTPEVAAGWTTSSSALCNEAISQEIFPGPFTPLLDILFPILDELIVIIDGALTTVFDALTEVEKEHVDPTVCPFIDDVLDGSAFDNHPFRVGDDGQADDADVYYDFNDDTAFTADEWIWDCPPYRP